MQNFSDDYIHSKGFLFMVSLKIATWNTEQVQNMASIQTYARYMKYKKIYKYGL